MRFHPRAEEELNAQASYYEELAPGLGIRFAREVQRATRILTSHPSLGRQIDESLRQFALGRFPHSIIYQSGRSIILVLAVAHQKRRHEYWRERAAR